MEEFSLPGGPHVICISDHEQNGLIVALQLPVGRFSDPPGLEGLCECTAGMLSKGTAALPSEAFSEKLENAGATLFSDIGEEHCVLGMRLISSWSAALLPLFADMITSPRFDKEEFDRLQREMITALTAEGADPSFLSTRHFYAQLVGKSHPVGRFQTVASLKKITCRDVREFWSACFAADGSLFVIAGDSEIGALRRTAGDLFGGWKTARREKPFIAPPAPQPHGAAVRCIDKPDLTQTFLVAGHAAPGERWPRKNELLLANHIFGGGNFSSRLMTRIRTADGKTYGVSSQLVAETDFGAFLITTSTQNSQLREVLTSILEEYRRFCANGVTAEELDKARQFAIGNMAFQLEGIGNIVDKLLWLRFYGRPNSYIERFGEQLMGLDVAGVNEAIRSVMSPERLIIAAVGKKAEILPQLEPFGEVRKFHFRDAP